MRTDNTRQPVCKFIKKIDAVTCLRALVIKTHYFLFIPVFRMAAGICDESFRANVELCIQHVEDFLTFKPEKVTIFSDADAAEVVCRCAFSSRLMMLLLVK